MRYRKRPVVIEARQLDRGNAGELIAWINASGGDAWLRGGLEGSPPETVGTIFVRTPKGTDYASLGDFVVQEGGEFSLWKPDDFAETYEEAA